MGKVKSGPKRPKANGSIPKPGVPTPAAGAELPQLTGIAEADRKRVVEIRKLAAEHLGSDAAALVWLGAAGGAFAEPPLELIRVGKADVVLAYLKSQAGPGAAYA